jgi:hypothetical protein
MRCCQLCLLWLLLRLDALLVCLAQHREYSAKCHGEWERCDRSCIQVYRVYTGAQGHGAPCPVEDGTLRPCSPGTGNCPAPQHSASTSDAQQRALSIEDPSWRLPYVGAVVLVACVATASAVYVDHCRDGGHAHANSTTAAECPYPVCNTLPDCSSASDGCLKTDDQMDNQFFDNPARASAISVQSVAELADTLESVDDLANTFEVELE